jgi:hypothetical protein
VRKVAERYCPDFKLGYRFGDSAQSVSVCGRPAGEFHSLTFASRSATRAETQDSISDSSQRLEKPSLIGRGKAGGVVRMPA